MIRGKRTRPGNMPLGELDCGFVLARLERVRSDILGI